MHFQRSISLPLAALLVLSQMPELQASQSAPQAKPAKLNIVIIEGDGAINNVKQRVAREVIVQVDDENNRPVAGAAVAFLLPNSGAGGWFSNGAGLLNVTTNSAGRATAHLMPNSINGAFQINVTASYQGQVASATIPQTNAAAAAGATASGTTAGVGTGTGISTTTVAIIAAAVAGAVAVGVAARGKGNESPAPVPGTSPSAPTVRIGGTGTPTIGTPGFQQSNRMSKPVPQWR